MLRRSMRYPFAATRARALVSGFLRNEDFEELSQLPSLAEALSRLREKTSFRSDIYRSSGEALDLEFLDFGQRISRTLSGHDKALVDGYLDRVDAENLKVLARGLLMNRPREEFHPLLMPGGPGNHFLPQTLIRAGSFEELASSLPHHPFRAVFRKSLQVPPEKRLFYLETGLDREFWLEIKRLLGKLAPLDRMGAGDILRLRADFDRFNVVHRGFQAGLEEDTILAALPPLGNIYARGKVREALRSTSPAEGLARLFPLQDVPRPLSTEGETALWERLKRHLKRVLRSHPFDISISLAALLLKEMEIRNLETVLNGLRVERRGRISDFLVPGKG
jgi:vacuolar-type H+-ATPase subunit C/Vma6